MLYPADFAPYSIQRLVTGVIGQNIHISETKTKRCYGVVLKYFQLIYVTMLSTCRAYSVKLQNDWWIRKCLEGSYHCVIGRQSRNVPEGTQENHEKPQQTRHPVEYPPRTRLEHYHYINKFDNIGEGLKQLQWLPQFQMQLVIARNVINAYFIQA